MNVRPLQTFARFLQNHLPLVIHSVMDLLNKKGKNIVSAVIRDRSLYPPGEAELPDPVSKWASYTGSQKWFLGSVMLLVFRPLFESTVLPVSRPNMLKCCLLYRTHTEIKGTFQALASHFVFLRECGLGVFRLNTQGSMFTPAKIHELRERLADGDQSVTAREALLTLINTSSMMSHAIRTPVFGTEEVKQLENCAKDVVSGTRFR